MSFARVASIHFYKREAKRSIYGGYYFLPPVQMGAPPQILEISDRIQRDEGPVSSGPGGGRRTPLRYHVDAYEIARDIVSEWTENSIGMTPECHPGIWVIRDRIPVFTTDADGKTVPQISVADIEQRQEFRTATPKEQAEMFEEDLAHARLCDRRYAEWCFVDGNRIASDVRQIQFIPETYKSAARHYGMQADWLREGAQLEVMPCPVCTRMVSKRAIVCPFCIQPIDVARYAAIEAQKQQAVKDAVKQLETKSTKAA